MGRWWGEGIRWLYILYNIFKTGWEVRLLSLGGYLSLMLNLILTLTLTLILFLSWFPFSIDDIHLFKHVLSIVAIHLFGSDTRSTERWDSRGNCPGARCTQGTRWRQRHSNLLIFFNDIGWINFGHVQVIDVNKHRLYNMLACKNLSRIAATSGPLTSERFSNIERWSRRRVRRNSEFQIPNTECQVRSSDFRVLSF